MPVPAARHILHVVGEALGPVAPDHGHHLEERDEHEADGGAEEVDEGEGVDAALHHVRHAADERGQTYWSWRNHLEQGQTVIRRERERDRERETL